MQIFRLLLKSEGSFLNINRAKKRFPDDKVVPFKDLKTLSMTRLALACFFSMVAAHGFSCLNYYYSLGGNGHAHEVEGQGLRKKHEVIDVSSVENIDNQCIKPEEIPRIRLVREANDGGIDRNNLPIDLQALLASEGNDTMEQPDKTYGSMTADTIAMRKSVKSRSGRRTPRDEFLILGWVGGCLLVLIVVLILLRRRRQ